MTRVYPSAYEDADSRPFWAALGEGRLDMPRCDDCGRHLFYPRAVCTGCGGERLTWVTARGQATVHSFTTIHERGGGTYVIALVDLAEGPRMITEIIGERAGEVAIGDEVVLTVTGDPARPFFRLAGSGPGEDG